MDFSSDSGSSDSEDFDIVGEFDEEIVILCCADQQEAMFQSFVQILEAHLGVKVWPSEGPYHDIDGELYRKSFKERINGCGATIVFLTNALVKSKESIQLIEYAKTVKEPLIVLVIEEIENYNEIQETILTDCSYICEIYKARINKFGFDQFLWTSSYFKTLISRLENMTGERLSEIEGSDIQILFTIENENGLKSITCLEKNFQMVEGNQYGFFDYAVLKTRMNKFKDLSMLNLSELLNRSYKSGDPAYNYTEALLESNQIECKYDYLNLIQYIDIIIDKKLNEFIEILDFLENLEIRVNYVLSPVIVYLFKNFYESGRFKVIYKNLLGIKKNIYIVKLEDFQVNEKEFENLNEECCINYYDLNKHKDDSYNGYEFRRLLNDLQFQTNIKIKSYNLEYKLKHDLFVCDLNDNQKTNDFKNFLKKEKHQLNIFEKSEIKDTSENAVYEIIEKSKIILFFITNEYLKNGRFFDEYLMAKEKHKAIILLVFEPIDSKFNLEATVEMYQLNIIEYDYQNKKMHQNLLYRMWYLISKELNKTFEFSYNNEKNHHELHISKCEECQNVKMCMGSFKRKDQISYISGLKMVNGQFLKKHLYRTSLNEIYQIYDVPENNHIVIMSNKSSLYLFNRNTLNFIRKTKIKLKYIGLPSDLCFVKCLNKICFITSESLFSINTDYSQVRVEKNKLVDYYDEDFTFICAKNEKIYVYDQFENKTFVLNTDGFNTIDQMEMTNIPSPRVASMKIINESIFYLTKSSIFLFDLDLNFQFKFGSILSSAECLLSSDKLNNYLFVLDRTNLKIFNLENFKYFGSIDIKYKNVVLKDSKAVIAGDNLIINSTNEISARTDITMFKLNFNFPNIKTINEDFICKMNTYKMHLLKKPIELPCGNFSCLECIYDNYNLVRNEFKCSFQTCNLNHELKSSCVETNMIENSLNQICKNQIEDATIKMASLSSDNDDRIESLENRFDLLENDLEIRFESLKIIFDEYCEKTIEDVNKFESILMRNIKKKSNQVVFAKRFAIKSYKSIVPFHIGSANFVKHKINLQKF